MNWRPIETAPKDGARVLLWDGEAFTGSYAAVAHDAEFDKWCDDEQQPREPTDWMPLPDPPVK